MISKLLEQAGLLADALKGLITVLQDSDKMEEVEFIGAKNNYINVFQ